MILNNEGVEFNKNGKVLDSGYVDDPSDSGGETNYGITQKTYDPSGNKRIRDISIAEVRVIYEQNYWKVAKCDIISTIAPIIAISTFDTAVNCGTTTAIRLLQEALGVKSIDGLLGPLTLEALKNSNQLALLGSLSIRRQRYYAHLCQLYPKNLKFLIGWVLRTVRVYNECTLYYSNNIATLNG